MINEEQLLDQKVQTYSYLIQNVRTSMGNIYNSFTNREIKNILISKEIMEDIYKISCVYFIEDTERKLVKIGYSNNLKKRLNDFISHYDFCGLQSNLKVIAVCLTYKKYESSLEKQFHEYFAKYHNYREWFEIDHDVLISELNNFILTKNAYKYYSNDTLCFNFDNIPDSHNDNCLYNYKAKLRDIQNRYVWKNKNSYKSEEDILYDIYINTLAFIVRIDIPVNDEKIKEIIRNEYIYKNVMYDFLNYDDSLLDEFLNHKFYNKKQTPSDFDLETKEFVDKCIIAGVSPSDILNSLGVSEGNTNE